MDQNSRVAQLVARAAEEMLGEGSQEDIEAALCRQGASPNEALRLVLFLPSAFAREYYEPQGIAFPDHFLAGPEDDATEHAYSDEPIYLASRRFARAQFAQAQGDSTLRWLEWSAEADAIERAKAQGLTALRMSAVHHDL